MNIPKEIVVERIRTRGDTDLTERAESELPEKVDTSDDAQLLRDFGLDPAALEQEFRGQTPSVGWRDPGHSSRLITPERSGSGRCCRGGRRRRPRGTWQGPRAPAAGP